MVLRKDATTAVGRKVLRRSVQEAGTKLQAEKARASRIEHELAPEATQAQQNTGSVEFLRALWDERHFLFRCAVGGALVGVLLAFAIPKQYDAVAVLMPPDSQSANGMALMAALTARTGGALGAVAGDVLGIKGSGALFVGILHSRTVEDRLIKRFELKRIYSVRLDEDARKRLGDNTSVSEDRKSGIITITVTDRDPKRAAALAQAYVEELDHAVADLSTSSAHRERVFLEERLQAVKQDLDQASRDFSQFASKNGAIDIKEQGRAMLEAAATLQGQLIATEAELKGLEEIYTPNNVRVRSVRARLSELKVQLEKLGGKAGGEGNGTGESATTGDSSYPSIRKLPILGVKYADLYRRAKIQETMYETLTQQYELAKVQEVKETPSVRVLDAAQVPERKSFPPRTAIIMLCGLAALAAAIGWVVLRVQWQASSESSGKILTDEIFDSVNARMPWSPPNGSRLQAATHRIWKKIVHRDHTEGPAE